jgi:hypothetical protein
MMGWRRKGADDEPPVDEPTWAELSAFGAFLRDRENILRRTKQWAKSLPDTELLESLRGKLHRAWCRRNE